MAVRSTQKKKPADAPIPAATLWRWAGWSGLMGLWVFAAVSMLGFDAADWPSPAVSPANEPTRNWFGPVGAHAAYVLLGLLGVGVIPLMLAAGGWLWLAAAGRGPRHVWLRAVGVLVLGGAVSGAAGVLVPEAGWPLPRLAGGFVGVIVAGELVPRFYEAGAVLWMLLAGVIGVIVAFDRAAGAAVVWAWRALARGVGLARRATGAAAATATSAAASAGRALAKERAPGPGGRVRSTDLDQAVIEMKRPGTKRRAGGEGAGIAAAAGGIGGTKSFDPASFDPEAIDPESYDPEAIDPEGAGIEDGVEEDGGDGGEWAGDEGEDEDEVGAPQVFDRDKLREKIAALPVRFASVNKESASEDDLAGFQNATELAGYKFPTLDLLEEPEVGFGAKLEEMVRDQAAALESALREYRQDGEVTEIESGPVITLYHVKLAPGTKVAAINALASDIARSLKSVNIRIVPNMAGRDTIGVEVPNPLKERVRLKELMADRARFESMKLPMFLGKDASGEPLIVDLSRMPHVLIAGTTGSGKSVCMNTIVMSFLYTKKPSELKLVLVDPKMVEMSQFKDIPHLMCPVVTEMSKAAAILEWAVGKMDERYELLAEAGCRDIASYNELSEEELIERFTPPGRALGELEQARIPRRLPYMVFIIDELADLMMTNKEVEGSIVRIAQKARAVGIHLILATQRPQANVVTGLIKGNMPCRITFKVASGLDSRIVLDQKGGELLLGMGDMLFLSPSSHKLMRAQGTLVDDKEIRRVVRFLKEVAAPSFERTLVQIRGGMTPSDAERLAATENNSSASLAAAQEDPLFDRAVEIVLETKRGSVSLLQRRLAIGYTRASRLIDLMGIAGIIGAHKGSVAREVMITPEEWEAIKAMADEMAAAQGITRPSAPMPVVADDGEDGGGATLFDPGDEGGGEPEPRAAAVKRVPGGPAEDEAEVDDDAEGDDAGDDGEEDGEEDEEGEWDEEEWEEGDGAEEEEEEEEDGAEEELVDEEAEEEAPFEADPFEADRFEADEDRPGRGRETGRDGGRGGRGGRGR